MSTFQDHKDNMSVYDIDKTWNRQLLYCGAEGGYYDFPVTRRLSVVRVIPGVSPTCPRGQTLL